MNTEQQQRIEQIERWLMLHVSANSDPYVDRARAFDELRFLLSIVKGQEAEIKRLKSRLVAERDYPRSGGGPIYK